MPKSTTHDEYEDNVVGKHSSVDDYREPRMANPLVASTVDDFVPDDNDYENFLVDENNSSEQHLSIDPFAKANVMKLSTTDEFVIDITDPSKLSEFYSENELTVNPMVKGFREQLDSDDEQNHQPIMYVL